MEKSMARHIAGNIPTGTGLRAGAMALALAAALAALPGCHGTADVPTLLAEAGQFHRKGENKAAIIQLKNLLQQQPRNGPARILLGAAYADSGDGVSAEKELRKALSVGG